MLTKKRVKCIFLHAQGMMVANELTVTPSEIIKRRSYTRNGSSSRGWFYDPPVSPKLARHVNG